ncbi:unnamed protein product [Polarella glacialis]|uniref:Uncharacterized protein n=1 Tax=Polarella glacialis TaxID=89957 RepID=A0A813JT45_POLGL|nr:unnamed protein product [Polarella glacialis]
MYAPVHVGMLVSELINLQTVIQTPVVRQPSRSIAQLPVQLCVLRVSVCVCVCVVVFCCAVRGVVVVVVVVVVLLLLLVLLLFCCSCCCFCWCWWRLCRFIKKCRIDAQKGWTMVDRSQGV